MMTGEDALNGLHSLEREINKLWYMFLLEDPVDEIVAQARKIAEVHRPGECISGLVNEASDNLMRVGKMLERRIDDSAKMYPNP